MFEQSAWAFIAGTVTCLQLRAEESDCRVKGFVFQGRNELIGIYTNINSPFEVEATAAGKFNTGG